VTEDHCRTLARRLRDLEWNPQRHLWDGERANPAVRDLVEQRQVWVARRPEERPQRRERFQRLRALNDLLRPWVAEQADGLEKELALCDRQLQANAVLQRRDYAFCLHPEATLRPFCTQFL
jgi:hypothetical protein